VQHPFFVRGGEPRAESAHDPRRLVLRQAAPRSCSSTDVPDALTILSEELQNSLITSDLFLVYSSPRCTKSVELNPPGQAFTASRLAAAPGIHHGFSQTRAFHLGEGV